MKARTSVLALIAAIAGTIFLAAPAQAGDRHHRHQYREGYGYYNSRNYNYYRQPVYYRTYRQYDRGYYYYPRERYYRPNGIQIGISIGN